MEIIDQGMHLGLPCGDVAAAGGGDDLDVDLYGPWQDIVIP
jgi:hypothetical protein